jgi:DivIVA domain-containing protein
MWFWVVVIVVVIGAVVVIAIGRDDNMSEVYDDRPDLGVPAGRPLTADDLRQLKFSTAVRGYRMDEVDALIERIQADLVNREHREHAGQPGEHAGRPDVSVGPEQGAHRAPVDPSEPEAKADPPELSSE